MSGDDRVYFFYLSVLLLFIGGSFLYSRRRRLSQTLQQAAVWGLIFVGIIIAYGFNDTLQNQLFGSQAYNTGPGSFSLKRQSDGHFYLRVDINGTPVRFLVDTGASQLVLTKRDAARVGIKTDSLIFSGQASTANGTVSTAFVLLQSVKLGDIEDRSIRAAVNGGDMEESLLGMSYLSRFSELSIRGDTLFLKR